MNVFKTKIFLAGFASLAILGACSNESNNPTHGETETNDESVTLNFSHIWPASGSSLMRNKVVEEVVAEFESAHPHITINMDAIESESYKERMTVLSAANNLPDVGFTWGGGALEPFVEGNRMAPLNSLLENDLNGLFVSGTTEAFNINGNTYGLPLQLDIAPIFYNRTLFEEAGVSIPTTYDEFLEVIDALIDHETTPIAVGNRDAWTGSLWYMYFADRIGGAEALTNAINGSGSFTEQGFIDAAAEIQNLVNRRAFVNGFNALSNDEANAEFFSGNAAMYLMGSWTLPHITSNESIAEEIRSNIGYFKFPTISGGNGDINSWVGGPGVGLFIAENTPHREEAMEFVNFFIQEWGERTVDAGFIPATVVDTSKHDLLEIYEEVFRDLANSTSLTLFADVQMSPAAAQVHLNLIQALFENDVTPEEFAAQQAAALE